MFAPTFRISLSVLALAGGLAVISSPSSLSAQESLPLPKARDVSVKTEEWIKTRQVISAEAAAWKTEQATLKELNQIRAKESEQLAEFVKEAGDRVNELATKRAAFSKEESDLKQWRSSLESELIEIEALLTPLIPRFPAPLREKIEEAILRLEAPEANQPLQNRARDLLLVLQAALEFQNQIAVDSEVREVGNDRHEVDVLYLGLTQAWYVDATGKLSGYGLPAAEGWTWVEDPSIASQVRSAIDIQKRHKIPAFVELPLNNGSEAKGKN